MEIKSFNNGDLWFDFPDEEMSWYYELIGDWIYGCIWVDVGSDVMYRKYLEKLK